MPDVNDDMDELFKKAGENYPLNTNSSDWNEVYKSLPTANAPLNNTEKKNKSRRLLWLLLLLPLTILTKYALNPFGEKIPGESISKNHSAGVPQQKNTVKKNSTGKKPGEAILNGTTSILPSKNVVNKSQLQTPRTTITRDVSTQKYTADNSPNKNADNIYLKGLKANADDTISAGVTASKEVISQNTTPVKEDAIKEDAIKEKAIKEEAIKEEVVKEGVINTKAGIDLPANSPEKNPANTPIPATGNLKKPAVINKADKPKKQKHFYAGILAGPDLSTVKFQKIIKTGFTAGITTGYQLNKKWSIETGLYLAKKYYYTKGKYFSKKEVPIPYNVKIENANGNCNMLEIPLNVKYTFKTNQKANWFVAAGISSYLMKKEDYGYRLTSYGQSWDHEYSYKNSSKNWASIINLSAGYGRNIGKTGMLRIEPYIKIPVKGVGIGSLPITSSGVHLGFTKNLF